MNGHYATDTYQKWKHEGEDLGVEEALNQWFSIITG
jgi:hypothetical protein